MRDFNCDGKVIVMGLHLKISAIDLKLIQKFDNSELCILYRGENT